MALPISLIAKCPHCGQIVKKNLNGDNGEEIEINDMKFSHKIHFYHYDEVSEDDHEWEEKIEISINIKFE